MSAPTGYVACRWCTLLGIRAFGSNYFPLHPPTKNCPPEPESDGSSTTRTARTETFTPDSLPLRKDGTIRRNMAEMRILRAGRASVKRITDAFQTHGELFFWPERLANLSRHLIFHPKSFL